MKKSLKTIALVLALTLALCTTAFAAGGGYEVTGDSVVFATDSTLNVSFTNDVIQDGRDYMIWVIAKNDAGMYIPTASSILYIGQTKAVGKTFTFEGVYPREITDSAVMISGPGMSELSETGLYTLGVIEATYMLGDTNLDGAVRATDAVLALQHSVEKITLAGNNLLAADVNKDGAVKAGDAIAILRYTVGKIENF